MINYLNAVKLNLLTLMLLITGAGFSQIKMERKKEMMPTTAELRMDMRTLWQDHVMWTRNVILCIVDDLPGSDQAVTRLLANQTAIGNAIMPFYGEDAGKQLTKLLSTHIVLAAEVVKAAKIAEANTLQEADAKWVANSNEIAVFLSKANPYWKLADFKIMMLDHLSLTKQEAIQRIKKDYDGDVIAYDDVNREILKMSDMLTEGILKQFPKKFKINGTN
jgi:hypothetical protein